jgi:hypothetical protein
MPVPAEEHIQYVPEPAGVDLRIVAGAAVTALILLGGSVAVLHHVYQRDVPIKAMPPPQTFAQPRVVTSDAEIAERKRLTGEQTQRLNTWAWANDQHTLVQIPIDRAAQLLVQKGKDAWAPLLAPQPALTSPTAGGERATTPGISGAANQPKQGSAP